MKSDPINQRTIKRHTICGSNYRSDWFFLDTKLAYCARKHLWLNQTRLTEVFGKLYLLFIGAPSIQELTMEINGEPVPIAPLQPTALFLTPFSIAKWHIQPCNISWELFVYQDQHPHLPKHPVLLEWNPNVMIESSDQLIQRINQAKEIFRFEWADQNPYVSYRVKKFIDEHYREALSIEEIARRLKLSYTTMEINFKKTFDITPSCYRHQLRLHDAAQLMMVQDKDATYAAYEVGYQDFSTYYRNLRKMMGTSPSQYIVRN